MLVNSFCFLSVYTELPGVKIWKEINEEKDLVNLCPYFSKTNQETPPITPGVISK